MRAFVICVMVALAVSMAVIIGGQADSLSMGAIIIASACSFVLGILFGMVGSYRERERMRQAELERERSRYQARNWPRIVSISELIESGREERDDNLS